MLDLDLEVAAFQTRWMGRLLDNRPTVWKEFIKKKFDNLAQEQLGHGNGELACWAKLSPQALKKWEDELGGVWPHALRTFHNNKWNLKEPSECQKEDMLVQPTMGTVFEG